MSKPCKFMRLPGLILLAALSGCSQSYYQLGEAIPNSSMNDWEQQPLQLLLAELGPPHRISGIPGGYVMGWEHWKIEKRALGVSLGPIGADALQLDWGDAESTADFFLVTVNQSNQVTGASRNTLVSKIGAGVALQPLAGFAPLAELDDLITPMPQHQWGASLLLPIHETLNSTASPDVGTAGVEQRGTPRGAGQRTLELD